MSDSNKIIEELQSIKFILTLSNSAMINAYLNKVIATTVRRKMWTLIDGVKTLTDISKEVGTSKAAVSYFIDSVQSAGLVIFDSKNPPRRIINYTPAEWLDEIEESKSQETKKDDHETKQQ